MTLAIVVAIVYIAFCCQSFDCNTTLYFPALLSFLSLQNCRFQRTMNKWQLQSIAYFHSFLKACHKGPRGGQSVVQKVAIGAALKSLAGGGSSCDRLFIGTVSSSQLLGAADRPMGGRYSYNPGGHGKYRRILHIFDFCFVRLNLQSYFWSFVITDI